MRDRQSRETQPAMRLRNPPCALTRAWRRTVLAGHLAADEMEDAAQLPVRIAPARLELHGRDRGQLVRVARIEGGATQVEPVDEQPHAVPLQWFHGAGAQARRDARHGVAAGGQTEDPDLALRVE